MEASELIERLEKATGPDREIDLDLMVLGFGGPRETYLSDELGRLEFGHHWKFTASLDAALALVERVLPGTEWAVSTLYGRNHAEVNMNAEEPVTAIGATLPIALCLALLKAVPNCPPQAEAETVSSREDKQP